MEEKGDREYIKILKGLMEIPFDTGRNLLAEFLTGDYKNKSITKNRLDELDNFGAINWDKEKTLQEIDNLIVNGMIEQVTSDYNKFIKVLRVTPRGKNEAMHPTLANKKLKNNLNFEIDGVSEEDRIKFEDYGAFLKRLNDEQKKAVISDAAKILCIAGAGSGKTLVLTKRVEFLIKNKKVPEKKILAITFTRKAKKEMEKRLADAGILNVDVHTFNSFCENILRKNQTKIYGRETKVLNYQEKILAVNMALASFGLDFESAINQYYSYKQRESKSAQQLMTGFVNDCFSIIEYFKLTGEKEITPPKYMDEESKRNAQMIYEINKYVREYMGLQGLRDFSDQMIEAIKFLENNKEFVPQYEHVLVDEYQDVNSMQVKLLKTLNPANLFAVGDPRQAIFGWRGANLNYILNFKEDHGENKTINLSKNYRSSAKIVKFMNKAIQEMGLPDLEYQGERDSKIHLIRFESEEEEREFVIKKILESKIPLNEFFVLARTNRQLMDLSKMMVAAKISHVVKTDEINNFAEGEGVTLATIHAIKGLQAKEVFVIGCNEQNFPCKASDHPAIEMIKTNNYNREEEEKRLFYVAISRAKDFLYLTYSGKKPTYFITEEMKKLTS